MGWICVTESCKIENNVWDGNGIAFFSIADEILIIHDGFFEFLMSLSYYTYMVMILIVVITAIVTFFVSLRRVIKLNA